MQARFFPSLKAWKTSPVLNSPSPAESDSMLLLDPDLNAPGSPINLYVTVAVSVGRQSHRLGKHIHFGTYM